MIGHHRGPRCEACLTANNPGLGTDQVLEVLAAHFADTASHVTIPDHTQSGRR